MVDEDDGGGTATLGEATEAVCLSLLEENILAKAFVLCFTTTAKIDNYTKSWPLLEKKV